VKNRWVDLEYNKEYGAVARRRGGEKRCSVINLRWGPELQRLKNEERRREEGEKGQARMIHCVGGRGAGAGWAGPVSLGLGLSGKRAGWELPWYTCTRLSTLYIWEISSSNLDSYPLIDDDFCFKKSSEIKWKSQVEDYKKDRYLASILNKWRCVFTYNW
jgi:hypothetical protein